MSEKKKNLSEYVEGDCPNCNIKLDFDTQDRQPNAKIECPKCKEGFYINEAKNLAMKTSEYNDLIGKLTGKIKKTFEDNIKADERVDVKLQPHIGEGIVVTESRVIIMKAGNVSNAGFFGANSKSFFYNQISSVDLRIGIMGGHIQLTVAGSNDIKGQGILDMGKSENAVTFTADYKKKMQRVAEIIRERAHNAQNQNFIPQQNGDATEEIKKFFELKEQGIITEAEFEKKKKKLLEES